MGHLVVSLACKVGAFIRDLPASTPLLSWISSWPGAMQCVASADGEMLYMLMLVPLVPCHLSRSIHVEVAIGSAEIRFVGR